MTQDAERKQKLIRYFVDESGDGILFGPNGRDLLKTGEARRYFMLGFVELADELEMERAFQELRLSFQSDPLYSSIPSLDPARGKTALFFHAKDDHAELRIKVFELIRKFDFKFSAIIRDMRVMAARTEVRFRKFVDYRYNPDELYDDSVYKLFLNNVYQNSNCEINLSKRGASDRTLALRKEFEKVDAEIRASYPTGGVRIVIKDSRKSAGLQLVDYCLWALQRAYERGEVRFLHAIWDKIETIYDNDYGDRSFRLVQKNKIRPPTEEELKARWI